VWATWRCAARRGSSWSASSAPRWDGGSVCTTCNGFPLPYCILSSYCIWHDKEWWSKCISRWSKVLSGHSDSISASKSSVRYKDYSQDFPKPSSKVYLMVTALRICDYSGRCGLHLWSPAMSACGWPDSRNHDTGTSLLNHYVDNRDCYLLCFRWETGVERRIVRIKASDKTNLR